MTEAEAELRIRSYEEQIQALKYVAFICAGVALTLTFQEKVSSQINLAWISAFIFWVLAHRIKSHLSTLRFCCSLIKDWESDTYKKHKNDFADLSNLPMWKVILKKYG